MVTPTRHPRRVVLNDGNVRQISLDYPCENASDVKVYVRLPEYGRDYQLTLGSDYNVVGIGTSTTTAVLTRPSDWLNARSFAIVVHKPVNQPVDLSLSGPFGRRFEEGLDQLSTTVQTVNEKADRALKLDPTTPVQQDVLVRRPVPYKFLRYNEDGTAIVPHEGPDEPGGIVVDGIPDAPDNGVSYVRRDKNWEPAPEVPVRPTIYMDPDSLLPLNVNGTPIDGGFPISAQREILHAFSGGANVDSLPNLAATDIALCNLVAPTEESTNWVAATTPFMAIEGTSYRVVPLDIRTCLLNTSVSIPLFRPLKTNGFGFLQWEYIGEEPIHTTLTGTINLLMRVGSALSDPIARSILRLNGTNLPQIEMGQNNGRRHLATAPSAHYAPVVLRNYYEYNDFCLPVTDQLITDVATQPDLFTGYEEGYIAVGSTDEDLSSGGPEVRTTDWMDVSTYDKTLTSFVLFNVGGSSTSRVQIRTADGTIKYFENQSADINAQRVYRLPTDAEEVRINYTLAGDEPETPSFKPLTNPQSNAFDPLKGKFTHITFSVNRDVTFWPGGRYFIDIFNQAFTNTTAIRDFGFRYQSGGLQFLFDAGTMRKRTANTFFGNGS